MKRVKMSIKPKKSVSRRRRINTVEKLPGGRQRYTYHDTAKGIARTDGKTGKVTYLYIK